MAVVQLNALPGHQLMKLVALFIFRELFALLQSK